MTHSTSKLEVLRCPPDQPSSTRHVQLWPRALHTRRIPDQSRMVSRRFLCLYQGTAGGESSPFLILRALLCSALGSVRIRKSAPRKSLVGSADCASSSAMCRGIHVSRCHQVRWPAGCTPALVAKRKSTVFSAAGTIRARPSTDLPRRLRPTFDQSRAYEPDHAAAIRRI